MYVVGDVGCTWFKILSDRVIQVADQNGSLIHSALLAQLGSILCFHPSGLQSSHILNHLHFLELLSKSTPNNIYANVYHYSTMC